MAFATEPVFASLANILGKVDNVPTPVPQTIDNFKLYEVEIKYGLMQVSISDSDTKYDNVPIYSSSF